MLLGRTDAFGSWSRNYILFSQTMKFGVGMFLATLILVGHVKHLKDKEQH